MDYLLYNILQLYISAYTLICGLYIHVQYVYKALLVSLLFLMSLKLKAFILMLIYCRLYCFSANVDLLAPSGVRTLAGALAIATNVLVVAQCLCVFCCLNTCCYWVSCWRWRLDFRWCQKFLQLQKSLLLLGICCS
jgi:hypothetical protein